MKQIFITVTILSFISFGLAGEGSNIIDDGGNFLPDQLRCATYIPSEEEVLSIQNQVDIWLKSNPQQSQEVVTIPVAFHIVHHTNGSGNVPNYMLQDQIDVLNGAYSPHDFVFVLGSVDRTANNNWYNDPWGNESQMKSSLAIDPTHFLNFYTANPSGGILGWATFPWYYSESSYMHGVVVLYSTLPGGSSYPYDEGDTGTHEVGHYVGLYHTFQGGCTGIGDAVDDTPYEESPAFGCPHGRDSCPSDPGPDPIQNFMDYTDDDCMFEFTTGQGTRMFDMVSQYKPGLIEGLVPQDVTVNFTPIGEPIEIEASGGSFQFDVAVMNNESSTVNFNGWIMVELPSGGNYGPVLGPVNLSLGAGESINKTLTQNVPPGAPSGLYIYKGMIGIFPFTAWDTSSFTFTKLEIGLSTEQPEDDEWISYYSDSQNRVNANDTWCGNSIPCESSDSENNTEVLLGNSRDISYPSRYELSQNHPNPFNPTTTISYIIPENSYVSINVYDLTGKHVIELVNQNMSGGSHSVLWNGKDIYGNMLSAGVYLYRIEVRRKEGGQAGGFTQTRKMLFLK